MNHKNYLNVLRHKIQKVKKHHKIFQRLHYYVSTHRHSLPYDNFLKTYPQKYAHTINYINELTKSRLSNDQRSINKDRITEMKSRLHTRPLLICHKTNF